MLHQPSAFTLPLPSFGGPSHSPLSPQSNHNSFSSVPSFAPSIPAFGAAPFSHTPLAKCSHDGWGQQPFTNGHILNEMEAKHRQPNFAFGAQFHTPPIITPAPSPNPPFAEFPAHLPAAATTQASGMDTDKDMAPAAESPSLQQFHSAAFASFPSAPSTTAAGLSLSLDQAPPSSTPFSSSLAVTSAAALSPSISRSLTASTPVAFSGDSSLPPSLITSFSSSVLPSAPQSDLAFVPLMPSFPIGPAPGWQRVAGNMFRNSITKETHVCDFNCRSRVFSSQVGYFICGITGLQSRAHAKDGHKKRASESAISFSFSADPEALPAADAPAPVDCAISSEIEDSKPAVKRVMSFKANQ